MTNAGHLRKSAWIRFPRLNCQRWSQRNIVLLGDASATGHFSIRSGTKLAMESATALAECLTDEPRLEPAFAVTEDQRRLDVLRPKWLTRPGLI